MRDNPRRSRFLQVVVTAVALLFAGSTAAFAHVAYDSEGRFRHQSHSRDLGFYNGVTDSWWREETRDAQLDWHGTMNGSLRFPSVSHDAAAIHALSENYGDTGWIGYAWNWAYHGGHGHARLNTYYGSGADRRYMQKVACHEIGHFVGLAHSDDATDCLKTGPNFDSALLGTGHRDQMRDLWNAWGH